MPVRENEVIEFRRIEAERSQIVFERMKNAARIEKNVGLCRLDPGGIAHSA